MKNSKTTVRDRLVGKALIGFETKTGIVRMPGVKAGAPTEIKRKA